MSILMFEPFFSSSYGHFNRYVRVIVAEAARHGEMVKVAAHSGFDPALREMLAKSGVEVLEAFAPRPYYLVPDSAQQIDTARDLAHAALHCLSKHPADRITWLSGTPSQLLAAGMFAAQAKRTFPFQMIDFANDWGPGPLAAPELVRNAIPAAIANGVRLYAQMDYLANIAAVEFGHPFESFPPILEFKPLSGGRQHAKPRVGLMNIVHQFKDVSSTLDALAVHAADIQVVLHTGASDNGNHARGLLQALTAKAMALGKGPPRGKIFPGAMSPEKYNEVWSSLDAVLLPYSVKKYSRHGSGILLESLSDGIIPIVPRGTFMSSIAESSDVGIVYDSEDPDGISRALDHLVRNFDALSERSLAFAADWRRAYGPAHLYQVLSDAWTPGE